MPKYTKRQKAAMRLAEHDLVELLCALAENRPADAKQALADTKDSISILAEVFRNERNKLPA